MSSIFSTCNKTTPSRYSVTANFHRKTIPASSTQTQTMSFIDTLALAKRTDKVNMHISDIDVIGNRINGDAIPPLTTFVSMTYFRKEGDIMTKGNAFAGNTGWLSGHVGDIAVCTDALWIGSAPNEFDYHGADSTVNVALTDDLGASLHPVYREAGASYLVKITDGDQYIPWIHPDVPTGRAITLDDINSNKKHLDMMSLTLMLFNSLSGAVSGSVAAMPTISWTKIIPTPIGPDTITIPLANVRLGGPNNDGDFKLHFMPQLQSNENGTIGDSTNQVMRGPGIGFYFEGTLNVKDIALNTNIAAVKIVVPVFLTFQRNDNSGDFQVELQPIADLSRGLAGNSTGLDKIIVLANTPFGIASQNAADTIRSAVITSLTGIGAGGDSEYL